MCEPRIFCGVFPAGFVWADRKPPHPDGDYKRLAFLPFDTLTLAVELDCPSELRAVIESEAARLQARRGEQYQVTTAGQTVTLGYALKPGHRQ
jgi:hypothetical protein